MYIHQFHLVLFKSIKYTVNFGQDTKTKLFGFLLDEDGQTQVQKNTFFSNYVEETLT